jgi:hypothetical protein
LNLGPKTSSVLSPKDLKPFITILFMRVIFK